MDYTTVTYTEPSSRFEAPEAYVGYRVCDPKGRKLGRVMQLFTNDHHEPEYVRVKMGLFRLRSVLIPIGFVAVDEKRRTLTLQ